METQTTLEIPDQQSTEGARKRKYSDQIIQTDSVDNSEAEQSGCQVSMKYADKLSGRKALIIGSEKIPDSTTVMTYRSYDISVNKQDEPPRSVKRRFSDFEWLFQQLTLRFPGKIIPLLPEKSLKAKFGLETQVYQKERQRQLERFLNQLLQNNFFPKTELFHEFLLMELDEFRAFQKGSSMNEYKKTDLLSLEGLYNRFTDYKRTYLEKR